MRGWAFGLLGMTRREFYEMRPGEFWEALSAYNEKTAADRRHIGELVRGATLRLLNVQVAKKYRISEPSKFWPMPWDDLESQKEADEIHRLEHLDETATQAEVDKFFKRLNNGKQEPQPEG